MKNKLYKSLLSSLLFLSFANYSCQLSTACHKIGYGQQIHNTYFDKEKSVGYLLYSNFKDKNLKQYSLIKVDLNGNFEEIVKLDTKKIEQKDYLYNKLTYTSSKLDENTLIITEKDKISQINKNYYINLIDKKIDYTLNDNKNIIKNFSPDKEKYFYIDGSEKSTTLTFVDMKNKSTQNINISENVYLPIDSSKYETPKTHFSYDWVDNNNIYIYSIENDIVKDLFLYSIKDNKIAKINEYKFKENEPEKFKDEEYKIETNIQVISYENNTLTFYKKLIKKINVINSTVKNDHYFSPSPYSNVYKIDFSKNELSLSEEFKLNESLPEFQSNENLSKSYSYYSEKNLNPLIVGKELIYTGDNTYKNILDYREKLPKGYYDNDLLCGNNLTVSGVDSGE